MFQEFLPETPRPISILYPNRIERQSIFCSFLKFLYFIIIVHDQGIIVHDQGETLSKHFPYH